MRTKTMPSKGIIGRRIGVAQAFLLMTAWGCSESTAATPLTLESAAGRYILESVSDKPLPADISFGTCFLEGCVSWRSLVISGSFELGNPTAGTWSSQVTNRTPDGTLPDYTHFRTGQAAIRNGSLEFEEAAGPGGGGTWAGSLKADVLVVKFLDGQYSFRKVN